MDAIVAGKIEKTKGSMTFKSEISIDVGDAYYYYRNLTVDQFNNGYVRIITILDAIILIKVTCINQSSRNPTSISALDASGYSPPLKFYTDPDTRLFQLENANGYDLTKNIKSLEIGTLETV